MKSAREFYYEYYEGTSEATSFQSSYRPEWRELARRVYSNAQVDVADREISQFCPRYSNDLRFELAFLEILRSANAELRRELESLFIVLTFDPRFRAYVREHETEFDGEIVFLDLGISSAIIDYTLLFAMLMLIRTRSLRKEDLRRSRAHIRDYAQEIAQLQKQWRESWMVLGREAVGLKFWDAGAKAIQLGGAFSQCVNKFVMGHEIAHVLLGHMKGKNRYRQFVPFCFEDVLKSPEVHQREFHADMLSFFMVGGALREREVSWQSFHVDLKHAIGPLLALTIFGQQAGPEADSGSHPRVYYRYGVCTNLVRLFGAPGVYDWCRAMMSEFQQLLFRTQGFGLGERYAELEYVAPWEEEEK